jgi:hypothetical protein
LEASLKNLFVEKMLIRACLVSGSWSGWIEETPFWAVGYKVVEQDSTSCDVAILVDKNSCFTVF